MCSHRSNVLLLHLAYPRLRDRELQEKLRVVVPVGRGRGRTESGPHGGDGRWGTLEIFADEHAFRRTLFRPAWHSWVFERPAPILSAEAFLYRSSSSGFERF